MPARPDRLIPWGEPRQTNISVVPSADGRVKLVEKRAGLLFAETVMDADTARWLAGELVVAIRTGGAGAGAD